jgi:acyl-CoA reductase-like NAD-dependent aldehyde dehydrogenase
MEGKMSFNERFDRVMDLAMSLRRRRNQMISLAVKDLRFSRKDTAHELELTAERFALFADSQETLQHRKPLGGPDSWVAVMLSYNGSAWLNIVIAAAYLAGNKVLVKFSSKGSRVMALTEKIYRPIFGEQVAFYRASGKAFMKEALKDPQVSAVVFFGFDEHVLPYQEQFRKTGKKMIFEGPGADPFIVFPDADPELALGDLITAKFAYSGQTCTAPKRIFVHRDIYDQFLGMVVEEVRTLFVGDPEDESMDVTPVASDLAVTRIKEALADATNKGAKILAGGKIEGNLVYPTVIKDATDDMVGMNEEVFGPVLFTSSFANREEVIARAANHKYGLRAAIFGGEEARVAAEALRGEDYCHPVPDYTFGKFGTVALNETRAQSWRRALVTKAVGGYGYSGWIWETVNGRFQIKQGPKLITLETSVPA